jgi:hypothetical protein
MPWWESKRYVYRGMNKRVVLGEERGEGGKGKRAVCGERGGEKGPRSKNVRWCETPSGKYTSAEREGRSVDGAGEVKKGQGKGTKGRGDDGVKKDALD